MNKEAILEKIKEIAKPYTHNPDALEHLNENTDFINDLKINSANMVDVFLDMEEEFDIQIDNDSIEKMLSVKATIEIISKLIDQKKTFPNQ